MKTVATKTHTFTLSSDSDVFSSTLHVKNLEPGVDLIHLKLTAPQAERPPIFYLRWNHPVHDIHACWNPVSERSKSFKVDYGQGFRSNAATSAPVVSLFNTNGENRLTFAFSDALNTIRYRAGISEEDATFHCSIEMFTEVTAPLDTYEGTLLVDTRNLPYYENLNNVQVWWSGMPEYLPAPVPEAARNPMYSTWYSMHQQITAADIEAQCAIAKTMGMDAVIVDDGWQTGDNNRGYAYCGDWEVYTDKVPNMRAHVDAVHRLGMKFVLWYSVPFIGKFSQVWQRFQNKILTFNERLGAGVLDPRYPDVRDYIIEKYEDAVKEWDLDGFKLDFIDSFYVQEESAALTKDGHDYTSVPAAVDRLLTDTINRLRAIKPDIMIEFRQSYIGPAMRKYGNMFRASDCPYGAISNRVRTLDIRLICGDTAAHADMIMWHEGEPVESAALQMLNILFSVPQVSVLLDRLPSDHYHMLKHWLGFWREHRDVLLDGKLYPLNPELLYPTVRAEANGKTIIVSYHDAMVTLDEVLHVSQIIVVNSRMKEGLYLGTKDSLGSVRIEIYDCCGSTVDTRTETLRSGIHPLNIPAAGYAVIKKVE
ncbi:glycoside hydrolase family 36 protein [Paenibacillus alba]|uniref:Alpha-galactosidase n=1 Tax=Paenibacillus alba TaxID=1197127 RepID=A0ABU6FXP9_9BACL|nr:glycoside hydrolase family 36 protein [Paenibacillus alba]MEC0226515.1 alpha-galactosidase [Paenibacillus alba]